MHTAIQQTSVTSQAIPPLPILVPSGEPERRDLSGTPVGVIRCHCGRDIPASTKPIGYFEIGRGQWGAMVNCACRTTKARWVQRLNITATGGIVGRFRLIPLEAMS